MKKDKKRNPETKIKLLLYNNKGVFTYITDPFSLRRTLHSISGDDTMVSVYCKPDEEKIWKKKLYQRMLDEIFQRQKTFCEYALQSAEEYNTLDSIIKGMSHITTKHPEGNDHE